MAFWPLTDLISYLTQGQWHTYYQSWEVFKYILVFNSFILSVKNNINACVFVQHSVYLMMK